MIVAFSAGLVVGLVGAVLVMAVFILLLQQMVNIVQQGEVGVVKHLGEYRKTHEPGTRDHRPVRRLAPARRHARDPASG